MYRFIYLLLLLIPTVAFGQPSKSVPLPTDLAAVPNDVLAVAHIRLADIWKTDALKDVRGILEKAGTKAFEAFDKRFTPTPSSVDRITAYMLIPDLNGPFQPSAVFILTVSKPVDQKAFLKQFAEKTTIKKGKLGEFFIDEDESVGVRFLDDKTIAFGTVAAIQHMVDVPAPKKPGPLTPALELAASGRPIVLGVNTSWLPPEALTELLREIPEPLHPLTKAQGITLSLDFDGDGHLHAKVAFADKQAADEAEGAVAAATKMVKALIDDTRKKLEANVFGDGKPAKVEQLPEAAISLLGLGALKHAEDLLDQKPIKRSGESLTLSVPLPPHFKTAVGTLALGAGMMAPAITELRQSTVRLTSQNNLKQIGLALHNYHDTFEALPAAAVVDKKGKPQLSWRVLILPYIEQDALYKEFKLDEAWDSDHNKKLIDKMPKVYALPNKLSKPGHTHYRVFVGNDAMFDWIQGTKFTQITDGLSNTWMVVEAEEGVPWTKPDDLEFDPKKDLPKLGKFFKGGFNVLYGDGSVRFYKDVPKSAKAMITRGGGEVIGND